MTSCPLAAVAEDLTRRKGFTPASRKAKNAPALPPNTREWVAGEQQSVLQRPAVLDMLHGKVIEPPPELVTRLGHSRAPLRQLRAAWPAMSAAFPTSC